VRAVYELARDWDLDIHTIVDEHRKPRHQDTLEDAERARMRANMVARGVPEPPFKRGGWLVPTGTFDSRGRKALIPNASFPMQFERGRPYWK
jgi:hypothetical protein